MLPYLLQPKGITSTDPIGWWSAGGLVMYLRGVRLVADLARPISTRLSAQRGHRAGPGVRRRSIAPAAALMHPARSSGTMPIGVGETPRDAASEDPGSHRKKLSRRSKVSLVWV